MSDTKRIELPEASHLDTSGWAPNTGIRMALYLIPAAESDSGIPVVTTHSGVGIIGMPMRAFDRLWYPLGEYGQDVVGESVLAALVAGADALVALSDCYQGSEWDGNNHRGRWPDWADDDRMGDWESHWDRVELQTYWEAEDWFSAGRGGVAWPDLCEAAEIDLDIIARDDEWDKWESVARRVAESLESDARDDGVQLAGTVEFVLRVASEWRAIDDGDPLVDDDGNCLECGHPADGSSGWGTCDSPAHGSAGDE